MRSDTGEQGGVGGVAWSWGPLSRVQGEVWLEEGLESLHLGLWGSVKFSGQRNNTIRPRLGKSSGDSEKEGSGKAEQGGWLVATDLVLSLRAAFVLRGHGVPGVQMLLLFTGIRHMQNDSPLKYIFFKSFFK